MRTLRAAMQIVNQAKVVIVVGCLLSACTASRDLLAAAESKMLAKQATAARYVRGSTWARRQPVIVDAVIPFHPLAESWNELKRSGELGSEVKADDAFVYGLFGFAKETPEYHLKKVDVWNAGFANYRSRWQQHSSVSGFGLGAKVKAYQRLFFAFFDTNEDNQDSERDQYGALSSAAMLVASALASPLGTFDVAQNQNSQVSEIAGASSVILDDATMVAPSGAHAGWSGVSDDDFTKSRELVQMTALLRDMSDAPREAWLYYNRVDSPGRALDVEDRYRDRISMIAHALTLARAHVSAVRVVYGLDPKTQRKQSRAQSVNDWLAQRSKAAKDTLAQGWAPSELDEEILPKEERSYRLARFARALGVVSASNSRNAIEPSLLALVQACIERSAQRVKEIHNEQHDIVEGFARSISAFSGALRWAVLHDGFGHVLDVYASGSLWNAPEARIEAALRLAITLRRMAWRLRALKTVTQGSQRSPRFERAGLMEYLLPPACVNNALSTAYAETLALLGEAWRDYAFPRSVP